MNIVDKDAEKERSLKNQDPANNFIANELENMFSRLDDRKNKGYSKLGNKWKRKDSFSSYDDDENEECGPEAPGSKKYLGEKVRKLTREQEVQRQKQQRDEFNDYNEKHDRSKPLLELHKENKDQKKREGHKSERREFDRTKDLMSSR